MHTHIELGISVTFFLRIGSERVKAQGKEQERRKKPSAMGKQKEVREMQNKRGLARQKAQEWNLSCINIRNVHKLIHLTTLWNGEDN